MPYDSDQPGAIVRDVSARLHGVYVVFAAIAIGGLGWFALRLFAPVAAENAEKLPQFVQWCVTHRAWMPLAAAPAFLCGLMLLSAPRRSCLLIIIALLAMLLPFVIVLYCFVSILAPWYQTQSL